ncbi:ComEC/Rec2 family competence protein [Pseudoclavibacter sp. VKM Ac-2888]|uniref:ComEC/Rec2 family competence protein n=1 Tax=Pseudoclavibacter sp. VKM Ac-2888 TaxID=2783830 RepID=UPI00188D9937|nr:ComEC/Rec2 family competence protein [Pseudoclavibacter sp. VKM Ac-2888]MBF4551967.1 ComEC/Rec2 family competence protein [Pseudoclavibacter sp. VKM Ac-2888]
MGNLGALAERLDGRDARLVPAAAGAWVMAWICVTHPSLAWVCGIGLALLAIVLLAAARLRPALATFAVVAAVMALLAVSAGAQHPVRSPEALRAGAVEGLRVQATGTLTTLVGEGAVAAPGDDRGRWSGAQLQEPSHFEVRLDSFEVDGRSGGSGASLLAFGQLSVPTSAGERLPAIGSRVELEGVLGPAEAGDSVAALVFLDAPAHVVAAPGGLLEVTAAARDRFVDAARALPGLGAQLLPGLSVGDTRLVGAELDERMKTAALTHLTAVSGSNCAVVVAATLVLARLCGLRRGVRLALAAAVLAVFVALVTPEGSVIRASIMAMVVLVLEATPRRSTGLALVALATVVVLVADPWRSRDYGFALSVLATVGLLTLANPIGDRLARVMPRPVALMLAVPASAQLACQPVLLLLTPELPLYGILANVLAAPAAPVATLAGLVGCLLLWAAPWLGQALLWVAWLPAQWIGLVAMAVSDWPGALLPWPGGLPGALLCLAVVVALIVLLHCWRAWLALLLCVALVAYVGTVIGQAVHLSRSIPSAWRYAACDIGQGDALLVTTWSGSALIDTGAEPDALLACLETLGVDELRLLVLTHFDLDHTGAATALLESGVGVGSLVVPDTAEARAEPLVDELRVAGAQVHYAASGDSWTLGDLAWSVLWPKRGSGGEPASGGGNEGSLVTLLEPTTSCVTVCLSLAALADLGEEAQRGLLREHPHPRADIVKMAHHGSRDQSAQLYEELSSSIGLVSVGADNGYGHPTDAALGMLTAAGTRPLRTDELGTIVIGEGGHGGSDPPAVAGVATAPRARRRPVSSRALRARSGGSSPPTTDASNPPSPVRQIGVSVARPDARRYH